MVSSSESLRLGEGNGARRAEGTLVGDFMRQSAQEAVALLHEIANATQGGTVGLTKYLNQIGLPRVVYAEYLSVLSKLERAANAGIQSIWERGRLRVPTVQLPSSEPPPKPPVSHRPPDVPTARHDGEAGEKPSPPVPPSLPSPSAAAAASHVIQIRTGAGRQTVFDVLLETGHDDGFTPVTDDLDFVPTDGQPGSPEKLESMTDRAGKGFPLWHPDDRIGHDEV